jgi:hypothetical protein
MQRYIVIVFLFVSNFLIGQNIEADSISQQDTIYMKYAIKLRVFSTNELVTNLNRQIIGLEFEKNLEKRSSLIIDFDIGYFGKYEYYKYYDFFQNIPELPYTRTTVVTKGFHIAPNYRYYALKFNNSGMSGLHIGGSADLHYYYTNYDYFDSRTEEYSSKNQSSVQLSVGGVVGIQFLIRKRLIVDFSSSLYLRTLTFPFDKEVNSKNSIWISENGDFWAVYRFKIGYAFGK